MADEHSIFVFELNVNEFLDNCILRFVRGSGTLGCETRLVVNGHYETDYKFPALSDLADLDHKFELLADKFGSFKYEFFLNNSPNPSGWGYFSVIPEWVINNSGKTLSLNSLSISTHLTKLLGPLDEWEDRLSVAKESGYNMIHLTPVQQLGISNSSYSISDYHKLNATLGEDANFKLLSEKITLLKDKWHMLTIQDVVWNHAAKNSVWLKEHPECGYNCFNSPHLRPAFIIDQALKHFSDEIAESKWESEGIPAKFSESSHIEALRAALFNVILPKIRIHEFFQIDVDKAVKFYLNELSDHVDSNLQDDALVLIQDPLYRRFGSTVDFKVAIQMFHSKDEHLSDEENRQKSGKLFRYAMEKLNEDKLVYSADIISSIVNATVGHVHYERVADNGPRIPLVTTTSPLTANYFAHHLSLHTIDEAESAAFDSSIGQSIMACNGWVMNCDPLKNFAEPDSEVYLRRELISWGDSLKLNYGNGPNDCPYLWNYMKEYTEQCARIFHGFRIDNCHSTPIHVAEYFLQMAREIRPELYVTAELFTGSEDLDNIFVNRLGITSLIREAQNAHDSHEQGRLVHRFSGDPVGAFRRKAVRPAPFSVAHALFYDQTHDNPSAAEKRTVYDFLPTAGMLSMSFCAIASSRGYDEFIPFHIHVVNEQRLYRKWSEIAESTGMIEARKLLNKLHIALGQDGYSEVFVDQYNTDVVAITRHNPSTRESVILISHTAFGDFKWIPDGHEHKGIPIADDVEEILFEAKTVEIVEQDENKQHEDADYLTGVSNLKVEVFEHVPVPKSLAIELNGGVLKFKNFPSGSIIALKIRPKPETAESCRQIDNIVKNEFVRMELYTALQPLSIAEFTYILFRCEDEEGVENGGSAYDIPSFGKLVYCGLKGIEPVLRKIQQDNDLGHPLCSNLRGGVWLPAYIVNRLRRFSSLSKVADIFDTAFEPLSKMPHFLRPCYFEMVFSYLYPIVEDVVLDRLRKTSTLPYSVWIVRALGLSSISMVSKINDALLPPVHEEELRIKDAPSLAAGLPHFSVGIWRNWGRDTFISLPGILLSSGRFDEARQLILGFAGTLRHGLIPNLLAEGKASRYNCRDAVWFWLAAIVRYVQKSKEGKDFLNAKVIRLYPNDDSEYSTEKIEPLHHTIFEALSRHFNGISFRERNAGSAIDEHMRNEGFNVTARICHETGFVFGGNALNCGTWMDKMGGSERANNRGLPATPRDGAAVELQGLALFVAESLDQWNSEGVFPFSVMETETTKWTWKEWALKIRRNFEDHFFVKENSSEEFANRREIIKDTFGSSHKYTDYQLRPNFCIALKWVPDIMNVEKSWKTLCTASEVLKAPLGICTLDPTDWAYCGDYDNDDDSYEQKTAKGWNYHQGPEWLWVAGEYLSARLSVSFELRQSNPAAWEQASNEMKNRIQRFAKYIGTDVWSSLPELTNRNGAFCGPSCSAQKKMTDNPSASEITAEEPIFKKPRLPIEKIKTPRLKHEEAYLRSIPSANQYEKSFMHRDTITHIVATKTDFIITASRDGHLKFWKKKHGEGVEFVKHFRCHLKEIVKLAVNHNGTLLATVCTEDKSIKVFDIVNFDMINMISLDFSPSTVTWVHQSSDVINALAVGDINSPVIRILDGKASKEPFHVIEGLHFKPVVLMEYNADADIAISIDDGGMIEFWSGSKNNFEFPAEDLDWDYKMETDFYEYVKLESAPRCLTLSPNGRTFTTMGADRILRVFDIKTGKLIKVLDETLQSYVEKGKENKNHGLPNMEWNRRIALEKELNRDPTAFRFLTLAYDFSSNFIIFPTPLGICVYNLVTDEIVRTIGKGENARFVGVALCRAVPDAREFLQGAATSIEIETAENPNLKRSEPDPMLIACAYKRHRFYIFTNAEPFSTDEEEEGQSNRDIFNEKPLKEETITADSGPQSRLSTRAIIHTTYGDIHVELYPDKCPRAVENFCTLSRRGYYNGLSFHRVIRSFMIQTGDPTGKGTGGQSIWGHDFEDEFHPSLKYDKPYRLAMANAGANTNGSQFFITVVPAEWLDGKNTLFGQVTEGFNVVQKINNVNTHEKSGRPKDNISIVSVSLKTE